MPASTLRELQLLFERAFNSGNVEEIVALYEPGAVLVSGGRCITGYEGLRDTYAAVLAYGARMKLDTRAVIESGEGLALVHGAWTLGPPLERQGISTEVVRRQPDGSWMFVIDSPYTPPEI